MNPWSVEERPIVIVEDNARERELIAAALTGYDLSRNVITMGSGAEMLDYVAGRGNFGSFTRRMPALVILDLDLEDVHGLDVLKTIRQDPEMGSTPVVIFSGSDSALDAAVARELRADGYIVKPSSFEDMQATVRSLAVFWGTHARNQSTAGSSNND